MRHSPPQCDNKPTLSPIRIIGVGSPFGSDRLGWEVAAELARRDLAARFPAGRLSIQYCDRPGAALLEIMAGAELAIILDAMTAGLPPGSIRCFSVGELNSDAALLSSHGFGVASTLALGKALDMLPARLYVLGIEIERHGAAQQEAAPLAAESGRIIMKLAETAPAAQDI
ncbi:MAG: hydrogenase maturation protease [Gammaproteobacteria bacterium]